MNILFLTHPHPNYVPDLLLHGLRKLLGPSVVDFPRKESLYRGQLLGVCPENQLCPGLFPEGDWQVDRQDLPAKIARGHFTYIISDVRAFPILRGMVSQAPRGLVLVDGEDSPVRIPPGPYLVCRRETDGSDGSIPLPMALPEELLRWIASYDALPKSHSVGFLGCASGALAERQAIIAEIAEHYPDSLLRATAVPSANDPFPAGRMGRDDYYRALQQCRIVLNLRGAGYDTFRFWENVACNAVHISQKMPILIPDDFQEDRHLLRFSDADDLRRRIDLVLGGQVNTREIIQAGRAHLIAHHLTTQRAAYLLDRLKTIMGAG